MIRRRSRKPAVQVSLFPFLAVLICTMGSLIVLLVLVVQQARVQAETKPQAAAPKLAPEQLEDLQLTKEDLHWRREILEQQHEEMQQKLGDQRLRLSHIEDHIRRLEEEWKQRETQAEKLQDLSEQKQAGTSAASEDLAELESQIEAAREELERVQKEADEKPRSFAIIPYVGPNGTQRRPIYIECTATQIVLQPEGVALDLTDLEGPLGPGNPLDAALRATREHLVRLGVNGSAEPYPLLVVRPEGTLSYALARQAMRSWDDEFGYELVDADIQLEFTAPDRALRELQERAIRDARQRQAILAAAMPSQYGRRRGFGGGGSGSGSGPYAGGGNGGSFGSGSGAGGFGSSRGPTGSGFQGIGQSSGGLGGSDLSSPGGGAGADGMVGANVGTADFGQGPGPAGLTTGEPGSGSAGSGPFGEQGRGATDYSSTGDPGQVASNSAGTYGGTSGSGGSSGNGSALANGGQPGATGQGNPNAAGGVAGGTAQSGGAQRSQGSGQGGGGGGETGGQMSVTSIQLGSAGRSGSSASSGAPEFGSTSQSNSFNSSTRRRGPNWGLPGGSASSTGVTRPIGVIVMSDRVIILPEQGDSRSPHVIPTPRGVEPAVEDIVKHLWKQMEGWGLALAGGYWKPVLQVQVGANAEPRYAELQRALQGSGIEVQRKLR